MIKLRRDIQFVMPHLAVPGEIKERVGKMLRAAILSNIRDQVQTDGSPLKRNPQQRVDYKSRNGMTWRGRVLSLVASEHRFTRPELWLATWSGNRLTIEPSESEDLKAIVKYVQQKGYVGWFGPRAEAIAAVKQVIREWIRRAVREATQLVR